MSDAIAGGGSAFSRLSSREQVMVVGLVAVLLLVGTLGVSFLVSNRLKKADHRLAERREQLQVIEGMEGQYRAAEAEQTAAKQKLQRNTVSLFSLLNKVSTELGLKLDNLNERNTPLKEAGIVEVSVDVALKEISITRMHKFMEKLEGPPNTGLVKITKLKVKSSFSNEENLDVNMTVATYKLAGGAAGAGTESPAKEGK